MSRKVKKRAVTTKPFVPSEQEPPRKATKLALWLRSFWSNRITPLVFFLAAVAGIYTIWLYRADQKAKVSTVNEQFLISPAGDLNGLNWSAMLILDNTGPATAKHIACTLLVANSRMRFDKPVLISNSDAGATIDTAGGSQSASISIKDLSPGRGAMLAMAIHVPSDLSNDSIESWKSEMFNPRFPKKLVSDVNCNGESIKIVDIGATKAPSMSTLSN